MKLEDFHHSDIKDGCAEACLKILNHLTAKQKQALEFYLASVKRRQDEERELYDKYGDLPAMGGVRD